MTKLQTMALKMSQITTQGTALGTNFAPGAPVVSTRYSSVTRRESSVVYYSSTFNTPSIWHTAGPLRILYLQVSVEITPLFLTLTLSEGLKCKFANL